MKAIIYTSNTGSTASYAKMLAQELDMPVYSAEEAKREVPAGSEIIYLGWLMAGSIKGYSQAAKRYRVCAVCGVGMGQSGTQIEEIRLKNKISKEIPVFTLQGNFDLKKLRGMYRFMMNVMVKTAGKALANKADRTPEEDDMLNMLAGDGSCVQIENLKLIIDWYHNVE